MNMQKLDLEQLYKETLEDCGKKPPTEFVEQEFLFALKEKGKMFLKVRSK